MLNELKVWLQYVVPQHGLSRLAGLLMESRIPWLKRFLISVIAKRFHVSLEEAERTDQEDYETFNDFFTRALKPGVRPIGSATFVSPADGQISQIGDIHAGTLIQAKGKVFTVKSLLGVDAKQAAQFENGKFTTIYLSPKDYHRVHMPIDGRLTDMIHVPGNLFSVNQSTTEAVDRLFARNERVVCLFDTPIGPVAVIMVGAMIVGSIETVWAGQVAPRVVAPTRVQYVGEDQCIELKQGEEMGRFKMGSTVILLAPPEFEWRSDLGPEDVVKMGQSLTQN